VLRDHIGFILKGIESCIDLLLMFSPLWFHPQRNWKAAEYNDHIFNFIHDMFHPQRNWKNWFRWVWLGNDWCFILKGIESV